ncbi:RNA binding protein Pym [Aspergillus ellipticus CBS 707.79]|uniref:RNA binding protein Pym n=1 Tax=Aspergillus ellipticus CBS 707.79 TaxID=1448320 RepID=A0A319DNZ6_9EURO|nr:RNA binding protein Pym [Aspergillus ellipticus CBS 707.79]
MSADKSGAVSSSGITTNEATGERFIPSSLRADGSKRREIRVRPGYRPPEDVELYKTRAAEAWKNRGRGGVPGAEVKEPEDSSSNKPSSASSNKNAKRREAKKKAKASQDGPDGKDVSQLENWRAAAPGQAKKSSNGGDKAPAKPEAAVDVEAENEKKARNLKKKLRQARDLRDKKNQGEALLPEQLEKVIKIQELVRQLDSLGFDSNGDKKEAANEKE